MHPEFPAAAVSGLNLELALSGHNDLASALMTPLIYYDAENTCFRAEALYVGSAPVSRVRNIRIHENGGIKPTDGT
jgi:hypothetical protein